jgi:ammonium transporter, Amt family
VVGALCVGLLGTSSVNSAGANGLFYGGGYHLLGVQATAIGGVVGYSIVATLVIGVVLKQVFGHRVTGRAEVTGLDLSQHGEAAYDLVGPAPTIAVPTNAVATNAVPGSSTNGAVGPPTPPVSSALHRRA